LASEEISTFFAISHDLSFHSQEEKMKNFHHRLNNEPIESVKNRYDIF